ncbi:hypothetical protein [Leptothoe spongobia]|uniref:Uncharacterized protein n=1 Tax=Leptothoe spongobia TAU-MAC 1115 TaxID=1967444 RepID=A0A947DHD5_9CYAN|nr:hypothetical protein [Leptothoe spongobia]MBT9317167.1 hypothetical protein [Leptothoe spongobia TAU-MAC 1115]
MKILTSLRQLRTRPVMAIWKKSLGRLLNYYDTKRGSLISFFPKLFIFFTLLNMSCYWLALLTAFPHEAFGDERIHYFLLQFPVGILGALFDSLSFFITVWIAKRALKTTSLASYIAHLSVDVVIAIVATWWVLFVFSFSGWLISIIQHSPESLATRADVYESRVVAAVQNPTNKHNLKNIYFGIVVGISAMLPTFTHLFLSVQAIGIYLRKYAQRWRLG